MNLETVDIEKKLVELAGLKTAMAEELKPHYVAIEEISTEMRAVEDKYTSSITEIEQIIKDATLLRATSFKSEHGKVSYRKGYVRASWDDRALLGYAVAHDAILSFRKETEVKPTVSIEVF